MMKKIVSFLSIIILIILTYIVSYKITLKDNYHNFLNILTYKYNKNKDYKIDFISLYIVFFRSSKGGFNANDLCCIKNSQLTSVTKE